MWVTSVVLTGKQSFLASTGCWKGHANWCFHTALSTVFCKNCNWFVTRPGLSGGGCTVGWTIPLTGSTGTSIRGGGSLSLQLSAAFAA